MTAADSARGAQLFQTLKCVECHSINGSGGRIGPDLGKTLDRDFTPAGLAATMWNHAPKMWAAMQARNVPAGDLNQQGAADLFAYFYSVRFFDPPGDAGRGKALFHARHCVECHNVAQAHWQSITSPIELVNAMWNHAGPMRERFASKKVKWQELSPQDLADLLVYLRNQPQERGRQPQFAVVARPEGKALFDSKGCAACHAGKLDLSERLKHETLTAIAAEMWNHANLMPPNPPQFSQDEMRALVSYLWAGEFFKGEGSARAGGIVFAEMKCNSCHTDAVTVAPKLRGSGRTFTAPFMVEALWHHGPNMLEQMKSNNIAWPRFSAADMANLIAYLNGSEKRK